MDQSGKPDGPAHAGLYNPAVLYPDDASLAAAIAQVAAKAQAASRGAPGTGSARLSTSGFRVAAEWSSLSTDQPISGSGKDGQVATVVPLWTPASCSTNTSTRAQPRGPSSTTDTLAWSIWSRRVPSTRMPWYLAALARSMPLASRVNVLAAYFPWVSPGAAWCGCRLHGRAARHNARVVPPLNGIPGRRLSPGVLEAAPSSGLA
ncbi:hypothetical protein E9229_003175 [Paeniglutamicibacter cryotolerans]|uniref:Uncharacterized protein n=1 Tax=Paeniglutamicibacter cryotolerans TaxID=670079 RepID=A0A839QKK3_9MICC|nr:hypothetical protein [Paeniglutamicibacter cryotolerans]